MKLKGKFHSPKIKRTPSKKGKQADLTVKTPEKSANKVSRWRTRSVSLAGFLLAGTQFIKICSSAFSVWLSHAEFCICVRELQGYFTVSYNLCNKRCIFLFWDADEMEGVPSLLKHLLMECSLMPDILPACTPYDYSYSFQMTAWFWGVIL